ncbi:sodium-dependent dopamine transporter-like [Pecten maximus]|uniref:sodium-dependent dopamine transporter-like n=1 Tax=Pecten maximus TaxID=6579 RepID=UPI001457FB6A|nr:sodium-dependent dopamine transporter-like [Pecten maximus]
MENSAASLKWASNIEFVVALLGYSIGTPEFWRVPYLTYRNGGGIGIAVAVINCIYGVTTVTLTAWALEYFFNSFKAVLPWTNCDNDWNTPACYRDGSDIVPRNMSTYNSSSENYTIMLWIEASFQTFLTLGPGWGGLMMMGAHNKFRTNSLRSSIISTTATLTFGLVNGLVVFSVLGVMSEEIGVPIADMMTSGGFSIGFIAYPKALSYFPLPQLWCAIFYFLILLPGLDAMATLTEPFLMILEEIFPKLLKNRRILLLAVVSFVMFLLSLPLATQAGVYIFLLVDWYTGTWSVMLICMAECIMFAWIYGTHRIDRDVRLMLNRPLPAIVRISTAFIMPVFLTCLLVISVFTYKPPSFGDYNYPVYARAIGWCFTMASILPALGYSVWVIVKAEGPFGQRIKHLARYTPRWIPADERAVEIYRDSERSADLTWKQLFWFNLTGRGGIDIKDCGNSVPML